MITITKATRSKLETQFQYGVRVDFSLKQHNSIGEAGMRGAWTKIEVPHDVRLPYGFYLHFKDRVALAENCIM